MSLQQQPSSKSNESNGYAKVHMDEIDSNDYLKKALLKSSISSKVYKQYGYRWVILFLFFTATMFNGIAYETCIPNALQFSRIYDMSDQVITATATIYMLMHPLFTFVASSVIVNKGFAYSIRIGSAVTILGFAIRLLVNKSFYSVLVGQVFTGIGRPFILNAQPSMAQNWFYAQSRTAVLTACNTIQTLSIVASLLMPTNLFFKNYQFAPDLKEEGMEISYNLMLVQFIMSLILIPGIFFIKANPPTPPSGFAKTDIQISFRQAVKKLASNKNFILIFISFSLYFGTLKGLGIIVPYLMIPFGYTDKQNSMTGAMVIIGGLVSSGFISKVVLFFKKFKMISIVLMICSIVMSGFLYVSLATEKPGITYGNAFVIGFFLVPLAPVLLEYSCEAIYPINGSFAVGLLISGATLFTVISSQVLTSVVKGNQATEDSVLTTILLMLGLLIVGLIVQLLSKEILNRSKEIQSRIQFSKSTFHKASLLKDSVLEQGGINKTANNLTSGVGDYPTEHPILDHFQFIAHPEALNPDVVRDLQDDDADLYNKK